MDAGTLCHRFIDMHSVYLMSNDLQEDKLVMRLRAIAVKERLQIDRQVHRFNLPKYMTDLPNIHLLSGSYCCVHHCSLLRLSH